MCRPATPRRHQSANRSTLPANDRYPAATARAVMAPRYETPRFQRTRPDVAPGSAAPPIVLPVEPAIPPTFREEQLASPSPMMPTADSFPRIRPYEASPTVALHHPTSLLAPGSPGRRNAPRARASKRFRPVFSRSGWPPHGSIPPIANRIPGWHQSSNDRRFHRPGPGSWACARSPGCHAPPGRLRNRIPPAATLRPGQSPKRSRPGISNGPVQQAHRSLNDMMHLHF